MEATKKAYNEILKALHKHKDICLFDVEELERIAKVHLYGLELKEKYGLNIDPKNIRSLDNNSFGDYKKICGFGEKYRRTISWSVDGRQPKNEILFSLGFSTGAYMFGYCGEYPTEFFQKFWLELKAFKPDYIDEANKSLYWKLENAKEIFNSFDDILKKYRDLNKNDYKQRQIEKLKADLAKLEKSS